MWGLCEGAVGEVVDGVRWFRPVRPVCGEPVVVL